MNKRKVGDIYEEKATQLLRENGYEVVRRNYRNSVGEIDIIVKKDNLLVFVEVKYRKNSRYGYGIEAIDERKISTIYSVAEIFMAENDFEDYKVRFDAISFLDEDVSWIQDILWGDEIEV